MFCEHCGTKIEDGAEFCQNCGHKTAGVSTAPRKATAPQKTVHPTPTTAPVSAVEFYGEDWRRKKVFAIASAFLGLFIIGYIKGHLVEHKPLRSAIELFVIGSIATTIGIVVGFLFKVS